MNSICLFYAVVMAVLYHLVITAPEGYEDATGFHYRRPPA